MTKCRALIGSVSVGIPVPKVKPLGWAIHHKLGRQAEIEICASGRPGAARSPTTAGPPVSNVSDPYCDEKEQWQSLGLARESEQDRSKRMA
jgi:hypothetical protein